MLRGKRGAREERDHEAYPDVNIPVRGYNLCSECDGSRHYGADEIGSVEQRGQLRSLFRIRQLPYQTRASNDRVRKSEADDEPGDDVHGG
jgi:hypothetical protein